MRVQVVLRWQRPCSVVPLVVVKVKHTGSLPILTTITSSDFRCLDRFIFRGTSFTLSLPSPTCTSAWFGSSILTSFLFRSTPLVQPSSLSICLRSAPIKLGTMYSSLGSPMTIRARHSATASSIKARSSSSPPMPSTKTSLSKRCHRSLSSFKGADVLIFDAQYVFTDAVQMKRDWGHSSSFVGIDLALDAEVDTLLLFHHDPMHTDATLLQNLNQARQYLVNMEPGSKLNIDLAYEGQHIILE